MQITILKSSLNRNGGLEKNVWYIANAFSQKGHIVKILTTGYKAKSSEFDIISFKKSKTCLGFRKILQFDKKCNEYLSKNPSDIIFGMDRNSRQTHIRAGNGVHRAYLEIRKKESNFLKKISFALNPLHRNILALEKKAFESRDLKVLFVNSNMVKAQIQKYYSTDPEKIKVIHNGVQWESYADAFADSFTKKDQLLKKLNISKNSLKLLFAGNGYERKGLAPLLNALSFFKKNNLYLFVAGKDKNIASYQRLVIKLGIQDKVFFLGAIPDLTPYYQLCDIFVLPTMYDPFANVILEALSMGLFVITTKNNGASEILNKHQGIVLDNSFDIEALKKSIEAVLQNLKTFESAKKIRNSVSNYDYSKQLEKMLLACV